MIRGLCLRREGFAPSESDADCYVLSVARDGRDLATGDLVIVDRGRTPKPGDLIDFDLGGVAQLPHRWYPRGEFVDLLPWCGGEKKVGVARADIRIHGVCRSLVRLL